MAANAQSIILHQYDISPFSEKVRVVLGIKGLDWFACDEPIIMPKPELVALTGGYRKIPVMQIGADIYCDSQSIIRELERRFPSPSIHVGGAGAGWTAGMWSDRVFFQAAVAIIFGGGTALADEAFIKDREKLTGRPFDIEAMKAAAPLMAEQFRAQLGWIEEQLGDGRSFVLGEKPSLADASAFYNLAFVRWTSPNGVKLIESFPGVAAWEKRVAGIGHGNRQEVSREDALDIAKAATSTEAVKADPGEPNGLKPGDRVSVMADDYGRDAITGELVSSSAQHIAIKRNDPRVGDVVVHFPRAGFFVMKS
ncbi:glutathione S-transferase family protein [Parvibaculum sp.]|uniref:glutathione S-transferase family protein n=1 Tax=Parvibaculum sp. TaxID=2024848 RepID=UPI001B24B527|nr:glutathione S-transferase family protein [Parvibaculum sp.]MBO6634483.1 glutathione S-transferase family protein [Parvibaculum sp.]MBO6677056.1 glutathione S-transferase family protein [Parvibaculum sp.]MBO6686475.1 glutathione S-transferase family protein [Parvibaculum sp.]MBO6904369.1 glutathione S-transferase family protein [Parvibaculum sp.]